jgi:hypothetical protein
MEDSTANVLPTPPDNPPTIPAGKPLRCVKRGCKDDVAPLIPCGHCKRTIHYECYVQCYGELGSLPPGVVVCTGKCYQRLLSLTRRPGWHNDGGNGPDDPVTSERILLDWLTEEGNYSRYRGKNNNGVSKNKYAQRIADIMNSKGVRVKRDAKMVVNKISALEDAFKNAFDFANSETGAGLMEQGALGSFEAAVKGRCAFYYDLLPIMKDRSSAKPKCTSEELDEPDEEPVPARKPPPLEVFLESSSDESSLIGPDFLVPARTMHTPTTTSKATPPAMALGASTVASARSKSKSVTRSDSGTMSTTLSIQKKAGKRKSEFTFVNPEDAERMASYREEKIKLLALDSEQKALDTQAKALRAKSDAMDFRMKNIERLTTMRTNFPHLTRKEILDWMPDLKDAADLVWKEEKVACAKDDDSINEFTD